MSSDRGLEITAVGAIAVVLLAVAGWFAWPSLSGADALEPDDVRMRIRAWVWPAAWVPETGQTLPSPNYLDHPPQYIPPYPLPDEMKGILEAQQAQQDAQNTRDDK